MIGPLFGAALYEDYGFRTTSDVTALITFGYVLVFIFILTRATALPEPEEEQHSDELLIK